MEKYFFPGGVIGQHCPQCGGDVIDIDSIEKVIVDDAPVYQLWINSRFAPEDGVDCPNCGRVMRRSRLNLDSGTVELDVCRHCRYVWFDPGEMELTSAHAGAAGEGYSIRQQDTAEVVLEQPAEPYPESWVRKAEALESAYSLLTYIGLPVREEFGGIERFPFITVGLIVINILLGIFSWSGMEWLEGDPQIIEEYGFITSEWCRKGGVTILTSMFIHGGIFHLLGNMYFLGIFGCDLENMLGYGRYAVFVLAGGLCATLVYACTAVDPTIPCVGASGYISSVVACFAITYPRQRLGFRYKFYWYYTLPVWSWFGLWVVGQLLGAYLSITKGGTGGVAYMAHLGGAIPGIMVAIAWKKYRRCSKKQILPVR